ncbi:hypothetical protein [Novosphingobium rosa]|uniref:hypothetical protein n=1 Tax=Novosphingobium rosa TaxID=76978 RepID=UPI0008328CDE|nr:hypothetical protein [Novosphingobium rosa]
MVADNPSRVGRTRINDPEEKVTARFPSGTLARIKAALAPKEPQSEFLRQAVERELSRRAEGEDQA